MSQPASSKVKMSCKTQCNKNKQYCQAPNSTTSYSNSFFLSPFSSVFSYLSMQFSPLSFLLTFSIILLSLSLSLSHSYSIFTLTFSFLALSLSVYFLLICSFYLALLVFFCLLLSSSLLYLPFVFPSLLSLSLFLSRLEVMKSWTCHVLAS